MKKDEKKRDIVWIKMLDKGLWKRNKKSLLILSKNNKIQQLPSSRHNQNG